MLLVHAIIVAVSDPNTAFMYAYAFLFVTQMLSASAPVKAHFRSHAFIGGTGTAIATTGWAWTGTAVATRG